MRHEQILAPCLHWTRCDTTKERIKTYYNFTFCPHWIRRNMTISLEQAVSRRAGRVRCRHGMNDTGKKKALQSTMIDSLHNNNTTVQKQLSR